MPWVLSSVIAASNSSAVVELKLKQLVRALDACGLDHARHAEVGLEELVKAECLGFVFFWLVFLRLGFDRRFRGFRFRLVHLG
jgi:hypothetical protein